MTTGTFKGATLDSRQVKPGMLFVAVKGERVDGHDFIPQALAAGAAGIVDGREELARAAAEYRRTLKAKVIGITGSAGKTTTKELVAAFLRAGGFRVHATAGNFNNDLGLPLTILNCPEDAEFLVVEMGTNHPGEIAYLVDIARPDAGVISSIGTAHIEFFKTQDGIADEKGTLFARLPPDGFAVVGVNNDRYERLCAMSAARVVAVDPSDAAGARIAEALAVRLPGAHNVSNARLAAACAGEFGVPLERCLAALADFSLPGDRWRVVEKDGVTYVNDCYNANPTSMIAALETFAAMPCAGRRVAVLGDMFELGYRKEAFHEQVLARAMELPINAVFAVGEAMAVACAAVSSKTPYRVSERIEDAEKVGVAGASPANLADVPSAKEALATYLRSGDAVLLKASHGMHLEAILA